MSATYALSLFAHLVLYRRVCVADEDLTLLASAFKSVLLHRRVCRVDCVLGVSSAHPLTAASCTRHPACLMSGSFKFPSPDLRPPRRPVTGRQPILSFYCC